MSSWRFTDNARVSRRVTVDPVGAITVVDALEDWFPAQKISTGQTRAGSDSASVRRLRTDLFRYRLGLLGPLGDPLRAGDRIQVNDVDYEILENPRDFHLGRMVIGAEASIKQVTKLYPFEGAINEQGGAPVKAAVRFSVYSTDEIHETTGTYEVYAAETDLGNHAECKINHNFTSDGKVFKITAAENDLVGGFVRMTVRKAGAS